MSIRINVDPTNPGQFFACCGLLELANRLWGEAEGWFENEKGHFCIESPHLEDSGDHTHLAFTNAIAHCTVRNTMTELQLERRELLSSMTKIAIDNDPLLKSEKQSLDALWREAPVLFGSPFNLRVDWFMDDRAGGAALKTWAGQQSVVDIADGMRSSAITGGWESISLESCLFTRSRSDCLPFNFDSDLGSIGGDRDIGFSFDPLKNIKVDVNIQVRPLIELLAFIGLQRFRPMRVRSENRFQYCLWFDPMLPEVASAAACGLLDIPSSQLYEFRLLYRTKYLKSFLSSTPTPRSAL
jgi:CRISPR-associated protein Csb3